MKVCNDVCVEPSLQPLTGETFDRACTITTDETRLDISAKGFWDCQQECTFFDVRVFNPFALSYRQTPLQALYQQQEQMKRRQYEDRVRQVERASFVPLIFTTSGGTSKLTTTALKRLAPGFSVARNLPYSVILGWLCCRLGFCLLRSSIMCLRGSRPRRKALVENLPDLACATARIPLD